MSFDSDDYEDIYNNYWAYSDSGEDYGDYDDDESQSFHWSTNFSGSGSCVGSVSSADESCDSYNLSGCIEDEHLKALKELCCKVIGQNLPFEAVDQLRSKIPDDAVLSIFRYTLPLDPSTMGFFKHFINVNFDWASFDNIRHVEQIGAVLSCKFHFKELSEVVTVSINADRGKITRVFCSECHKKFCPHVVELLCFHFRYPEKVARYLPVSDYLNDLTRNELQAVFQKTLARHYDERVLHSVMKEINSIKHQDSVLSAIDPTLGGSFRYQSSWYLDSASIRGYCQHVIGNISAKDFLNPKLGNLPRPTVMIKGHILDSKSAVFTSMFNPKVRRDSFGALEEFFTKVLNMLDNEVCSARKLIGCFLKHFLKSCIFRRQRTFERRYFFLPFSSFDDCFLDNAFFALLLKAAQSVEELITFYIEKTRSISLQFFKGVECICRLSKLSRDLTFVKFKVNNDHDLTFNEEFTNETYSFNHLMFIACSWKQFGWLESSTLLIENVEYALKKESAMNQLFQNIWPHSVVYFLQSFQSNGPNHTIANLAICSINSYFHLLMVDKNNFEIMSNPLIILCFWLLSKQNEQRILENVKILETLHIRTKFILELVCFLANTDEESDLEERLANFSGAFTADGTLFLVLLLRICQYFLLKYDCEDKDAFRRKLFLVIGDTSWEPFVRSEGNYPRSYMFLAIAKSMIDADIVPNACLDIPLRLCEMAWSNCWHLRQSSPSMLPLVKHLVVAFCKASFGCQFYGHYHWSDVDGLLSTFTLRELHWLLDKTNHFCGDVSWNTSQKYLLLDALSIKYLSSTRYPVLWCELTSGHNELSEVVLDHINSHFVSQGNAKVVHFVMTALDTPSTLSGKNLSTLLNIVIKLLCWKWNRIPKVFLEDVPLFFQREYSTYRVPIILIFLVFKHFDFHITHFQLKSCSFIHHCRTNKPHFKDAMREIFYYLSTEEHLQYHEMLIKYPELKSYIKKPP